MFEYYGIQYNNKYKILIILYIALLLHWYISNYVHTEICNLRFSEGNSIQCYFLTGSICCQVSFALYPDRHTHNNPNIIKNSRVVIRQNYYELLWKYFKQKFYFLSRYIPCNLLEEQHRAVQNQKKIKIPNLKH